MKKTAALFVIFFFYSLFNGTAGAANNPETIKPPPAPELNFYEHEDNITLWWNINAENYDAEDPSIIGMNYDDTSYTFEGYIIRQHKDLNDSTGEIIEIYDDENGVTVIEDYVNANGKIVKVPVLFGSDSGLRRHITISTDYFNNGALFNGSPYYYSITSYAFSRYSSPAYIESELYIYEAIPGKPGIDFHSDYRFDEKVIPLQTAGESEATVYFKIVDPEALTGHNYVLDFEEGGDTLYYTLTDETAGKVLHSRRRETKKDTISLEVIDGFMLTIDDYSRDSIKNAAGLIRLSAIKAVEEVSGSSPVNVLGELNSTGEWMIVPVPKGKDYRQGLNWKGQMGINDYEIRFTNEGSEYYTTGYSLLNPQFRSDPKGKGRVPFEAWNITADKRLFIKILEKEKKDTTWNVSESGEWEAIYIYDGGEYAEPLPAVSGASTEEQHKLGDIRIKGSVPSVNSTIRISSFKAIKNGHRFETILKAPLWSSKDEGKSRVDQISVFPNPYLGINDIESSGSEKFVRFTGVAAEATIRIYTMAGVFVREIIKNDFNRYIDWDLRNNSGENVASGIYVAHISMPGIGDKILKLAVILERLN